MKDHGAIYPDHNGDIKLPFAKLVMGENFMTIFGHKESRVGEVIALIPHDGFDATKYQNGMPPDSENDYFTMGWFSDPDQRGGRRPLTIVQMQERTGLALDFLGAPREVMESGTSLNLSAPVVTEMARLAKHIDAQQHHADMATYHRRLIMGELLPTEPACPAGPSGSIPRPGSTPKIY